MLPRAHVGDGLSVAQFRALRKALVTSNRLDVHIELLNLNHDHLGSLTDYLIDGQVDVDATQTITRQLSMTLSDPKRHLPFDTDSPATTALFMDRMIRVHYRVIVNGAWVGVPIFTGPVTGLVRNGYQISVTAQGKEVLAMGNVWPPFTIGKGAKKTDAITKILKASGEDNRHLVIPDLKEALPHALSLYRSQFYWIAAHSLSESLNRQLYYDGDGFGRLRRYPGHQWTFDDDKDVVGTAQISYSAATANTVMIVGARPKGHKHPIIAIAVAPASHPLSPIRLGRNGVPRHILLTGEPIHMPHVTHHATGLAIANRKLDRALLQQVEVEFDALPGSVALLDPHDHCHVNTEDMTVPFRLSKFSLPLRSGNASVGYHRNSSVRHAVRRHRR